MIWEDEVTAWGDVVTVLGLFALWLTAVWAAAAGFFHLVRIRRSHPKHRHAHA